MRDDPFSKSTSQIYDIILIVLCETGSKFLWDLSERNIQYNTHYKKSNKKE